MTPRSTFSLGAALLALALGGCNHAGPPVDETQAAPAAAAATAAASAAAPADSTPPPATAPADMAATAARATPAGPPPAPPSAAPVPGDASAVRRVTVAEAKGLHETAGAVIVDVRDQASWDLAHIAGAVHIPLDSLAQRLGELPRDKPIVTYCA